MTTVGHVLPTSANEVHADFAKPNSIMASFSLFGISVTPLFVGMISRADAVACLVTAVVQGKLQMSEGDRRLPRDLSTLASKRNA
jgi:hypothetical protein